MDIQELNDMKNLMSESDVGALSQGNSVADIVNPKENILAVGDDLASGTASEGGGGIMGMLNGASGGNPWNMVAGMAGDVMGMVMPGENMSELAQSVDANASSFNFGATYSADQASDISKSEGLLTMAESLPMVGGFAKAGNALRKGITNLAGGLDTKGGQIADAVLNPGKAVVDFFKGENPFKPIEYTNDDKRDDWAKIRNKDLVQQKSEEASQYALGGALLTNNASANNDPDIRTLASGLEHENDDNEGIALGTVGTNGLPNKAERGEVIVSLPKEGEFVFSKRLKF